MIVLIIPALNPDDRLLDLAAELRNRMPRLPIVVVDDGSSLQAAAVFQELKYTYGCLLCRHPENYGKGAAIKTGVRQILRRCPGCSGFVTADADGQHRAADICRVVCAMERNPDRLILGARNFDGQQVPFKSRWGNRITSWVFRLVTGTACSDTQTGLRGIPARYAKLALNTVGERFEYEMNFLLQAARAPVPFLETPIDTVYVEKNRTSHFRPLRDSARIYGVIARSLVGGWGRGGPPCEPSALPPVHAASRETK